MIELVKSLIAVGIIYVLLFLEVLQVFNPEVIIPTDLKLAAGAVLVAYGFQIYQTEKKAMLNMGNKHQNPNMAK